MSHAVCSYQDEDLLPLVFGDEVSEDLRSHVDACDICQGRFRQLRQEVTVLRNAAANASKTVSWVVPAPALLWQRTPGALGKYLVLNVLGEGGQATVYRALHPSLQKEVAIKLSHDAVAEGEDRHQLVREARLLAGLDHPNIARVYDLDFDEQERPFVVMQYVRGTNLAKYAKEHRLSPRDAALLIAQTARALAAAHATGIVHQDIKPSNILMDEFGQPHLADFGLARLPHAFDSEQPSGGTAPYMAPEQARGETTEIRTAADIFALGAVLYALLTGTPPFQAPTWAVARAKAAACDFDAAALARAGTPRRLQNICLKAMAADPKQRYATANDLAADLERFARGPRLWRNVALAAAALLLLAAVWGALQFLPAPGGPPPAVQKDPDERPQRLIDVVQRGDRENLKVFKQLRDGLPLRTGDLLRLAAHVPRDVKATIFWLDSEGNFQEHRPSQDADGRIQYPPKFDFAPLAGPPGTEFVLIVGNRSGTPAADEIKPLLGRGPLAQPLPDNVLVLLQRDDVSLSVGGEVAAPDLPNDLKNRLDVPTRNALSAVQERLDNLRKSLLLKCDYFTGVAFAHVAPDDGVRERQPLHDADRQLLDEVMGRLLSSDLARQSYPAKYFWPPRYFIKPNSARELNAYATASPKLGAEVIVRKVRPALIITEGYLKNVVKGDANILAVIMGHELAHITKDHVAGRRGQTDLLLLSFSRADEIEADLEGMRFVVAAGYPYRAGITSAVREMQQGPKFTSFEGLLGTHPTWEERLALLDREQPKLWSAMSAFENGRRFLSMEQYSAAEACFREVAKEFPNAYEAWANLGYALLMQYFDKLDVKDVRRFDTGQIVAGGFYNRPLTIAPPTREIDTSLWQAAVAALEKAARINPKSALAHANLGLAHLFHPEGKDTEEIDRWFTKALALLDGDKEVDCLARAAVLLNAGVADLANEKPKQAKEKFQAAEKLAGELGLSGLVSHLEDALLYNKALLAQSADEPAPKREAFRLWERYLLRASPSASWWPLALEQYTRLGKELSLAPLTEAQLAQRLTPEPLRPATSVKVGGEVITLGEPLKQVTARLGEKSAVIAPLFRGANLSRLHYAAHGVEVLADANVLAVFLRGEKAPPLELQKTGVAGGKSVLRIGMKENELSVALTGHRADASPRAIDRPDVRYLFYPDLGLLVRVADGRIEELALAQLPRRPLLKR